jgi:hypothetical protein
MASQISNENNEMARRQRLQSSGASVADDAPIIIEFDGSERKDDHFSVEDLVLMTTKREEILDDSIPEEEFAGVDFVFSNGKYYGSKLPPMELLARYVKFLRKIKGLHQIFNSKLNPYEIGYGMISETQKALIHGDFDERVHNNFALFQKLEKFSDNLPNSVYDRFVFVKEKEIFQFDIRQRIDHRVTSVQEKKIKSVQMVVMQNYTKISDILETDENNPRPELLLEVNYEDGSFCTNLFSPEVIDHILECYVNSIRDKKLNTQVCDNVRKRLVFTKGSVWYKLHLSDDPARLVTPTAMRTISRNIFMTIMHAVYEGLH